MPVFNQDPKIKEGSEVLVLDSLEEVPEQVKDGTIVVVPSAESEESGGSESGDSASLADLEKRVSAIERDHQDNTDFITSLTDAADNEENEGKVLGIKDGMWQPVDAPTGGGGTKVIDLNDEKYGEFGAAICQFVLTAEDGTYNNTADVATTFVEECNTEEPLIVKMGLDNGVIPPLSIEISSINKCYQSGVLAQVSFGVTIFYNAMITANLAFTPDGKWYISKTTQPVTG